MVRFARRIVHSLIPFLLLMTLALWIPGCGTDAVSTPVGSPTDATGAGGGSSGDGSSGDAWSADIQTADSSVGADGQTTADAGPADAGAAPVSLKKEVLPILNFHCGLCHRPGGKGPAVANQDYYKTTGDILSYKGKHYTPGESSTSFLIGMLKQEFGVGPGKTLMPPPKFGIAKVSDPDIALIAKWIDEGAKDN